DLLAERTLYAAEHAPEHAIIRVEVGLALHQNRAAEMIEAEQARSVKILFDGAQQGLPFLDRNRHALGAQPIEEIEEHRRMPPLQASARGAPNRAVAGKSSFIGCTAAPGPPSASGSDHPADRGGRRHRRPAPS